VFSASRQTPESDYRLARMPGSGHPYRPGDTPGFYGWHHQM